MNYNGYVMESDVIEDDIDKSLRVALKQESKGIMPVRGPKIFATKDFKYTNTADGNLSHFEGREEITKHGKLIYFGLYHGGLIE